MVASRGEIEAVEVGGAAVFASNPAIGQIEVVSETLIVSGWALPTTDGEATAVVDILVDGRQVVSSKADYFRVDRLVDVGRARVGFRIAIPPLEITRLRSRIEAKVGDAVLPGGPLFLDLSERLAVSMPGIRDGSLLIAVDGWKGRRLAARLIVDGAPMHDVALVQVAGDSLEGRAAGRWVLPPHLRDGQLHAYVLELCEGNAVARSDITLLRWPSYSLGIEVVTANRLVGWVCREAHPLPLQLELRDGDMVIDSCETTIEGKDVRREHGIVGGTHRFEMRPAVSGAPARHLDVIDADTSIVLCRVAIAHRYDALREVARGLAPSMDVFMRTSLARLIKASTDNLDVDTRLLPPASTPSDGTIDVVVPVYGGANETAECIESVLAARNMTPARILIVDDATPDPGISLYLEALKERGRADVVVLRGTHNRGFSAAVNIGMIAAGRRDVILLNADTIVNDGWIDRLAMAAEIDPCIATVTPLSNNGEIVTVPYTCKVRPVATIDLAAKVDQMAARVNAGVVADLPVAIGFCMLVRRAAIDAVGLFDAAQWGRGYGEEVDFCLQAAALGWRHVAACDTFVVHRGNVSFGDEKVERIKVSAARIAERYPFYDGLIQRFRAVDPTAAPRRALNVALIADALPERRILHLAHTFGGGTDRYVADMARLDQAAGVTPIFLRFDEAGGARLEVDLSETALAGLFLPDHIETYAPHEISALKSDIERLAVSRVHVHAPFGVSQAFLSAIADTVPFEVTIHDYAWICPRATLSQGGGTYCGEPPASVCDTCVRLYKAHPALAGLLAAFDGDVGNYRTFLREFLAKATRVRAGARDVVARLQRHGLEARFHVEPHPESNLPARPVRRRTTIPLTKGVRVALIGGLSDIKGYHLFVDCARYALSRDLPLQFIVFGYTMDDAKLASLRNVVSLGAYREAELDTLVAWHDPHISLFLSQIPETYSYALSHAFRLGIWPVVTDIGAIEERVRATGFGVVISANEAPETISRTLIGEYFNSVKPGNLTSDCE